MYIWVLNEDLRREYLIQKYVSLTWNTAFQEAGNFELHVGVEQFSKFIDLDDEDKTVFIEWTKDPDHVGVVEVVEKISEEDGNKELVIKGRTSEEAILKRRVIEYYMVFSDVLVGDIQRRLIQENFINPIKTQRQMPQIIQGMSTEEIQAINKKTYMECGVDQNIYEQIKQLAYNAEIGFKMPLMNLNDVDRKLGLVLYTGVDRTIHNNPEDGNERIVVGQRRGIANKIDFYSDITEKGTAIISNMSGEEIGDTGQILFYPGDITSEDDGGIGLRRFEKPFELSDLSRTFEDEDGESYDIPEEQVVQNAYNLMASYSGKVKTKRYVTGSLPQHMQNKFRQSFNLGDLVTVVDDETGYAVDSTIMTAQEIISTSGYSISIDIGERSPITDAD